MVFCEKFQYPIMMFVIDDFGNDVDIYWEPCYDMAMDYLERQDIDL